MKYNVLGASELTVSEICLGTMTYGEQNSETQAHQQLDYALSRGVNFLDAAEMYPVPPRGETQGRTESYVGSWLKKQAREKVVVATKITAPGRGFEWIRGGPKAIDKASVEEAVNASLQRLQTDYIDLYQIHWPDRYVPNFGDAFYDPAEERTATSIEHQLEALDGVVKAGKVRYIGLSNESPWGVMQFLGIARERNLPVAASIQNAYSLLNRTYEPALSELTRREGIPLIPYSALAFGHLTGKYLQGARPTGARLTLFPKFGPRYSKENVAPATQAYVELAESHGLSPATMALAFVRSRWFVASTIIGATTLDQLKENIDVVEVELTETALDEIDAIHERYPNPAL